MSWVVHFSIVTHTGNFHRKGYFMLDHLACATIQVANLGTYNGHPQDKRMTISLVCALRLVKRGEMVKMGTRICVSTRDFGTYRICANVSFKRPSGGRGIFFCLNLPLLPYFVHAKNEGSGKPAHMRSLARAFAAR